LGSRAEAGREERLMLYYVIAWNDGATDRYPANEHTLAELLELIREVNLATKGAFTAKIKIEEEN